MTPSEIKAETQRIIQEERALADHLSALYEYVRNGAPLLQAPLDFDHTFQLWADMEAKHAARRSSVTFPSFVSTVADIREASVEAQKELAKLDVELGSRADIYRVLKPIAEEYEVQLHDALRRQRNSLRATQRLPTRRERETQIRKSFLEQSPSEMDHDDFGRQTSLGAQAAANCGLTLEHVRYMRFTIRDLERHGAHLDDQSRERLVDLRTRIADLCIEYQRNLNEENTRLWFTAEELAGMSPSFLESLKNRPNPNKPEELEYEVTLKYPYYFPIMKHCSVEETRRILEKLFHSRCVPENVYLLEETVRLREEAAKLLGYPSHAAYILETRMAASPENVEAFLQRLSKRLDKAAQAELSELRRLKRKDNLERYGVLLGLEPDNEIYMWDLRYYMTKYEEQQLQIDYLKIAEYFPLERVLAGMFDIYQQLLGLRFVALQQGQRWHEDVRLFEVRDASTAALMGYFYLDLHPREGKYGHAAVWPLQPSCVRPRRAQEAPRSRLAWSRSSAMNETPKDDTYRSEADRSRTRSSAPAVVSPVSENTARSNREIHVAEERQVPVAAMVANLSKAAGNRPSLLRHEEVVTLFHEFGHVMHHICSKPRFARFSGTRVERDFVEAPSQMLENWCWDREALQILSGHFERLIPRSSSGGGLVPEPLPEQIIERLQRARCCLIALQTRRQIVLALFDQALHHQATRERLERRNSSASHSRSHSKYRSEGLAGSLDSAELLARLQRQIGLVPMTPGTHFGASFGHLMSGYDAQYYGYLWSEVFACDMYASAFAEHPLDARTGYRYRHQVLAPGGSRDASDILQDFLGRAPQEEAFFRLRGL
jgi:Zn-dependent oligopeptidase